MAGGRGGAGGVTGGRGGAGGGGDVGREERLPKIARNTEFQKLMIIPHFSVFAAQAPTRPHGRIACPALTISETRRKGEFAQSIFRTWTGACRLQDSNL